jgi:hypothetical protein
VEAGESSFFGCRSAIAAFCSGAARLEMQRSSRYSEILPTSDL